MIDALQLLLLIIIPYIAIIAWRDEVCEVGRRGASDGVKKGDASSVSALTRKPSRSSVVREERVDRQL